MTFKVGEGFRPHVDMKKLRARLGTVRIQTAGFLDGGSAGVRVAEAVILGVRNFEEIRNVIVDFVKKVRPVAVETEAEAQAPRDVDQQVLNELRRIRKALESK